MTFLLAFPTPMIAVLERGPLSALGDQLVRLAESISPPPNPQKIFEKKIQSDMQDPNHPLKFFGAWALIKLDLEEPRIVGYKFGEAKIDNYRDVYRIFPMENCTNEEYPFNRMLRISGSRSVTVSLDKTIEYASSHSINLNAPPFLGPESLASGTSTMAATFRLQENYSETQQSAFEEAIQVNVPVKPRTVLFIRLSKRFDETVIPFEAQVIFDGTMHVAQKGDSTTKSYKLSFIYQDESKRSFKINGNIRFPRGEVRSETAAVGQLSQSDIKECLAQISGAAGLSWSEDEIKRRFEKAVKAGKGRKK